MSRFIAALPMYDWPEVRAEVDAQWARLRHALSRRGIDAPEALTRPDASVEAGLAALWRHPALLFAQTCWGPMGQGLADHVQVIGQPDYSGYEGGERALYSSALVMRGKTSVRAPPDGRPLIPIDLLRGKRLAFNSADSMSGILALTSDLEAVGEGIDIFSKRIASGGHRASVRAVAEGRADVAAVDCRSWAMARRFEPAARELAVVGWTGRRKGLPYICARAMPLQTVAALREAATEAGMLAPG